MEGHLDGTGGRGNEDRREEQQGVGALHSTDEAGEPAPGDPVEGRELPGHGTVGGNDGENTESRYRLTETATDSEAGQGTSGYVTEHLLSRSEAVL